LCGVRRDSSNGKAGVVDHEEREANGVMPILHDAPDWRDLQNKLERIIQEQVRINGRIDLLKQQQGSQHEENKKEIADRLEEIRDLELLINGDGTDNAPGLKTQMDRIITYGQATAFWAKVAAWVVVFAVTALGVYIAWRELRQHSGQATPHLIQTTPSGNPALSNNIEPPKMDASAPSR
jgi:hypothetical protein